jgi:hypothetical protein
VLHLFCFASIFLLSLCVSMVVKSITIMEKVSFPNAQCLLTTQLVILCDGFHQISLTCLPLTTFVMAQI